MSDGIPKQALLFMLETIDTGIRWEKGVEHHPKSQELYKFIEQYDYRYNDDHHCFKSGGDGDNGEALMYLMDIFYEFQDTQAPDLRRQRDLYLQQRNQLMEAVAALEITFTKNGGDLGAMQFNSLKMLRPNVELLRAAINAIKDKELEQPSEDGE